MGDTWHRSPIRSTTESLSTQRGKFIFSSISLCPLCLTGEHPVLDRRTELHFFKEGDPTLAKKAQYAILLLLLLITAGGCQVGYILQAASGEYTLLSKSVPLEQGLKSASLGPAEKLRLALVPEVKAFGVKVLGLKQTGSYQSVYLDSPRPPVYTLCASPKDRLSLVTWWFPIVGNVPYLGFFDLEKAEQERDKLLKKGYDCIIGRADAYSTLGWFKDPVTLNLLEGSTLGLVQIILHEMTHATLYVKGQPAFNEGLAVMVGHIGALSFFEKKYGSRYPLTIEARESIQDERLFSAFLSSVLERLQTLYASPLDYQAKLRARETVFSDSMKEFQRLKKKLKTKRFLAFGSQGLNNAYLMVIALYHRHFNLFETVLRRNGGDIRKTILFLKNLSHRKNGDLLEQMQEWVQ